MTGPSFALAATAASVGFLHTLVGPDHYLPFVAMAKSRGWSRAKTAMITFLCGLGHVLSSVVLGLIGVAFGIGLQHLIVIEATRGEVAGWLLLAFGFVYFVWGLRQAYRNKAHSHSHSHGSGVVHEHAHTHYGEHVHPHEEPPKKSITPWILFTIFVFGPCEPLIPILMYPAASHSVVVLAVVTLVFAVATIATMLTMVFLALAGIALLPLARLERYMHALAGASITACAVAILFLGL